jgi:hypothetical protein
MTETFNNLDPHPPCFGITLQSIVPMRREPREQSEMVSQLLFGEPYRVEEVIDKWLRISACFDHYGGWFDRKLHREITQEEYRKYNPVQVPVLACKMAEIRLSRSSVLIISAGSSLPGFVESRKTLVTPDKEVPVRPIGGKMIRSSDQRINHTACQFLNVPYLWGGRSFFGMDCSGFVQTVFKIHGIFLPRDAAEQAKSGTEISSADEVAPGDLAFFGLDRENISHVGIVMPASEIIHCSGWVRIDRLERSGIYNRSTHTMTHKLQALRRVGE